MKSSAFPYFGNNPRSEEPFLNISKGDRKGQRSYGGRVYWQDETYNDNRVLMHVPENFDVQKAGRDRGVLPRQRRDAGTRRARPATGAAADFGFRRQRRAAGAAARGRTPPIPAPASSGSRTASSASSTSRRTTSPASMAIRSRRRRSPTCRSSSSATAAASCRPPGASRSAASPNRVRGVFLLDAVYGELDKFASWIVKNRTGFFVSAYTRSTRRHDQELMPMLRDKGIAIPRDMDGPLRPGSVVFLETPEGVTHRNYVTRAWTEHPVKDVLVKMAATPALTRLPARRGRRPLVDLSSAKVLSRPPVTGRVSMSRSASCRTASAKSNFKRSWNRHRSAARPCLSQRPSTRRLAPSFRRSLPRMGAPSLI